MSASAGPAVARATEGSSAASVRLKALLLDLDDTLVPDHADFRAAAEDAAAALAAPSQVAAAIADCARRLWGAAPASTRTRMTDISSWEALWAGFPADLDAWAQTFRLAAWRDALRRHGVDDVELAARLADAYRELRLARCRPYPEVATVLDGLRGPVRLAVVTNGMEGHQLAKLDAAGLTDRFEAVVISAVVGASKPDSRIFEAALDMLGCRPEDAAMAGDHPLRDIAGAQAAGLRAIWVDRHGGDDRGVRPDARVSDLRELAALGWW